MISVAELGDVHLLLPQIVVNFTRYFLQSNYGLFANSDDGLEKEDLDEACFGMSKLPR